MKVVMICEFFNEELDYQEMLLAKYYRKLGCDVTTITSLTRSVHDYASGRDARGALTVEHGKLGKVVRVPVLANIAGRIRVFRSIRRIVSEEKPDLLYFHDIVPNMIELRSYLRKHPQCCAIMDYHADYSNSGASWLSRLLLHRLSRRFMLGSVKRRLSAILPILPDSQRFLRDIYGVPIEQTELFPLGVDLDLANAVRSSDARSAVRRALAIPDDALVVFTGGKLDPLKRTEDVLDAVAALGNPKVHVIVVGAVKANADYQARLEAAAKGINAHFVGWQDREGVDRHQAAADIAIFPSSQSVLWQQSLGMGLPLVVSEGVGAIRARQDVGYMNLAGNIHVLDRGAPLVPQIVAFLRRCASDRAVVASMSAGADEVTHSLLSYERLARRTLEIADAHRRACAVQEIENAKISD